MSSLGNHDAYVIAYLEDPDWFDRTFHWLHDALGGAATLASYGVPGAIWRSLRRPATPSPPPSRGAPGLPARLPALDLRIGGYLFVHAGIRPGVPLEHQDPET